MGRYFKRCPGESHCHPLLLTWVSSPSPGWSCWILCFLLHIAGDCLDRLPGARRWAFCPERLIYSLLFWSWVCFGIVLGNFFSLPEVWLGFSSVWRKNSLCWSLSLSSSNCFGECKSQTAWCYLQLFITVYLTAIFARRCILRTRLFMYM